MLSITPLQRHLASNWSTQILAALQRIELGYTDTHTFGSEQVGGDIPITVGAVWVGDIFSWRVRDGIHTEMGSLEDSIQFFAGGGDGDDAARATGCLCFLVGQGLFKRVRLEAVQEMPRHVAAAG